MAQTEDSTSQDPKFIKYLLDPEEEYNCYFLVGNSELREPEKIGVVKKMLLAHSLVFRRELEESKMKEKGVVIVSDMFVETFKNLLRFVYGFDNTATLCFDEADNLFYASEKYMITGLKARLATRLMQLLTPDNICSLMNNPACYTELELNSAITHILQGETGQVLASPQFLDLTGAAFNRILEQEALSVPEIELWKAALKWAKHKTGSDDGTVLRKQLADQAQHIRICTVTGEQLCDDVLTTGVLTGEEIQLVCVSRSKKEKQDGLTYFCNEIEPRKSTSMENDLIADIDLQKKDLITDIDLQDHLQGLPFTNTSSCLTLTTSNNAVELLPLRFFGRTRRTSHRYQRAEKYQCDCTITITRITDHSSNTSTEAPITVLFENNVEYNKQFVVPVISNGQNVILLPKNKYIINVTFTDDHLMYYKWKQGVVPIFSNEHLSVKYQFDDNSRHCCYISPVKTLSYRPIVGQ